jgi:hypothetical protein
MPPAIHFQINVRQPKCSSPSHSPHHLNPHRLLVAQNLPLPTVTSMMLSAKRSYNTDATAQQVRLIQPLGRSWGMGLAPSARRHLVPSGFRRGCEAIHNAPSVAIVWPQPSRAKARRRPPPTRSARWPAAKRVKGWRRRHWKRWCLRKAGVEHLSLNQAQATGRLLDHFPLW